MINICVFCNPNYEGEKRSQSVLKGLDVVTQLVILYKSIKKNWKSFEYDFTVFYNKNIKWSEVDSDKLKDLEGIEIIEVDEGDHPSVPHMTRSHCFGHKLKRKGTHRLVLDCDMIAINEPTFDLSCDWQAMYAGDAHQIFLDFIFSKTKFKKINKKIKKNLFIEYNINNKNFNDLFPHFNGGSFLVKEELCENLSLENKKFYKYVPLAPKVAKNLLIQYLRSIYLFNLSTNWRPFQPGFNFNLHSYKNIDKFEKKNIILVHYCGHTVDICRKYFPEYFLQI